MNDALLLMIALVVISSVTSVMCWIADSKWWKKFCIKFFNYSDY